jgi:hypothetical protein
MDEQDVRTRAQAICEALVAGNIELATADFSQELRRNLGEVVALLPLPASEATIESLDHGGAGYNVIMRLVGETEEVLIQTRWKDRAGRPTVVEASHLSRVVMAAPATDGGEDGDSGAVEPEGG